MASSYSSYANAASSSSSAPHTVTALKRWSCAENDHLPPPSQIKSIHIYDFDNTLFASPMPNKQLWHQQSIGKLMTEDPFVGGGWWHDSNILAATGEGLEKEEAKAWEGWWNETVASLCQLSINQKDALSVLLTGRGESRFQDLLRRMIKSKGLSFHMVCLKPKTGPSKQTFRSTMNFKQELLKNIMYTYSAAEEIRVYEDRPRHVEQFRDFFQDFNRQLMGHNPPFARNTIDPTVIEVATKAVTLNPVTEIAEVQRMINAHNEAWKAGLAPGNAIPYEIKKNVLSGSYLVEYTDSETLKALIPPAVRSSQAVTVRADQIAITTGPPSHHDVERAGGMNKKVRWRVTALGVIDGKLWAARVEPVSASQKVVTLNNRYSIVLAINLHNTQPRDVDYIRDWVPVRPEQAVEFDTKVGEMCTLNIVKMEVAGHKRQHDEENFQPDSIGHDHNGHPPAPRRGKWNDDRPQGISNNNYRGGNQGRGRGQNRRDEGGRGRGRGGFPRDGRGGSGRGGRGSARGGGSHYQGGGGGREDHGRAGYTDYDASNGRNENGSGGLYNAY